MELLVIVMTLLRLMGYDFVCKQVTAFIVSAVIF